FLNRQDTLVQRKDAAARVPAVKILKGEQVLQQGQVVTASNVQVLKELGLLNQGIDVEPLLGSALIAAVIVAAVAGYGWFLRRPWVRSTGLSLITAIVVVTGLIVADIVAPFSPLSYLIVPTAAMMLAALVDAGLGIMVSGLLALSIAVLTGSDLSAALVSFLGGMAGALGVSRLSQRYDIIRAGLLVGAVNFVALSGVNVMQGADFGQSLVWEGLMWAFIDGVLAAILAMGSIPLLEGPFGILTSMKLVELSNPNQPLLRKLMFEAPGTYNHSLMVGTLAEAATEAVCGNSLLARVGAYYHDIGKTKRPYFFVENQFGGDNPHDRLAPSLSALIISSHVRDGVELAKEYHLPPAIIEFIQEHHGTTLIQYFYHKAVEADHGDGVVEEDYRYDGPRPQNKETAIVMLADISEASTRTLKNPSPKAIEQLVRKLMKERLEDGQLDESNLTLKDLDVIAMTFTRVLSGVFHHRIEYPESVVKEMERSRGRGSMDRPTLNAARRVDGNGSSGHSDR
ncbi:MAG: HDIG domain-containing protein, partial [Firmicutes bacterium]|nr:HDIG domain-containing protein [Bacillota bacterium]